MAQSPEPTVRERSERGPESGVHQAYDEITFRHFLAVEQKRAERAGRIVLLLLVDLDDGGRNSRAMSPALAARLFGTLTGCLREVDYTGWYRTGRTAGAVLVQGPDAPPPESVSLIGARVGRLLRDRLSPRFGEQVHVRVVPVRPILDA